MGSLMSETPGKFSSEVAGKTITIITVSVGTTMAGLKSATGYVRSELGSRVRLRRTPEVIFVEDDSIERGTNVISLLNRIRNERTADPQENQPE